ncbi:MAG: NAD(P)/FAD-dependent oxidoreductase [Pseudomonadales bacterium]
MSTSRPALVVIGGGIAGISLAARASEDFNVTVLEAESQPAYHSSGRSAAVAIECYENEVVRALTVPGMDFHRSHGAKPIGCVTIADEDHLAELAAFEAQWAPVSDSLVEMEVADMLARVPILRPERVSRVLIETQALSLDAHAELESFRRQLLAGGGRIVTRARVERIARRDGQWEIGWAGETLRADVLVNAAGAWGDELAALAGVAPLGLQPKRRTAFLLDLPMDISGWPLVHRAEGGLYFKPEAGSLMVSLAEATPSAPCDAQPEELDLAVAVDRFQSLTTVEVRRMAHTWAGLRTFLPDGYPAAGYDPDADGFFWLVGQGGFGIQTAPGLSEVAAGLLKDIDHPLAARIAPARFR